jgi:xanthine/uracil/vitamin C permease (AzgA family)
VRGTVVRDGLAAGAVAAAVSGHLALSVSWALVLARSLPRRRSAAAGAAAGLAIAALDLGVVGRRFSRVRALPTLPRLADHAAYSAIVGAVLARPRRAIIHP